MGVTVLDHIMHIALFMVWRKRSLIFNCSFKRMKITKHFLWPN